ncbi:MAG: transporter substrate-binding domain-containing protein [Pseudomonadota bacterium]
MTRSARHPTRRYIARLLLMALILAPTWLGAQDRPTDKVVAAHYPPLMIDGAPDRPGLAVEVLQEAAHRAGREIDLQFYPFERAIHAIITDPATLMPSLFKGKDHDKDILWLTEIQRAGLRFASVSGVINDMDQARALSAVVVERGTTSETLLNRLGFDNVQTTRSPRASARMLATGRAQAWLLSDQLMNMTWQSMDMPDTLIMGDVVLEIPVFLVASPSLPDDVRRAYRAAVQSMRQDGTLARIIARYDTPAE